MFLLEKFITRPLAKVLKKGSNCKLSPAEDCGNIFGDIVITPAIIDRIVHNTEIMKIEGDNLNLKIMKIINIFLLLSVCFY